ncbi:Protein sly1 [Dirofilaria immitis]|nr:Protein sly1 [Dirofilaria immitis]
MTDQTDETIRMRQIASLKQLLNLNQPLPMSMAVEPVWKILILDHYGQDIISPLLTIKQLRDLGITLHLLLSSHRQILPDVPAVYFVSPTDENVKIICDDLNKGMYDSYYLNMISPLSRPRLEQLASAAVHGGTVQHVQKLMDQFLNFISLEDDLFVLRRYSGNSPFSFYAISDPKVTPQQMEILIDSVVDGLFSVCATLGVVPIIRCPKDNAAEQVAVRLDQKLRDNFRDARNNLFVQDSVRAGRLIIRRPVLIIGDRGMDIATMLRHTWTYQALIHDLLVRHKGSSFPLVAEAIQEEVEAYKNSEDEIKRLKYAMGIDDVDSDETVSLLGDATSKLTSTVGSLPEVLEKKRLIDLHTTVATAVLDQIKQRKLDVLFEAEEKVMNGLLSDSSVIELMRQSSAHEDILRIMLINYLCSSNISQDELREQADYLKEVGLDDAAVKSISNMNLNRLTDDYSGGGIKTDSMFANLLNRGSQLFMEGVKNLVPKSIIFRSQKHMVDAIVTGNFQSNSRCSDAEFRYYDPKLMHSTGKEPQRARNNPPQDIIVFVIGGGNYVEYQNIVDYGKSKGLTRITYGCTELVNPKQFVEQSPSKIMRSIGIAVNLNAAKISR